jgi:pimeloyl-ACP methyl ester carboxylesterase
VVVPDLRGLGWSDAPDADYRKSTLATDVLELMTELGIDTVPVIGHDWGAIVAQLMAVAAPTRVESVLSLSVPSMFRRGTDPRQLLGVAHMPVLSAPLAERAVPRIAASLLRLSRFSDEEAEPYLERLRDPARARASVAYYRTFLTREAPALLSSPPRRPDVPMRFMGGVGDPVCRYSPGIELVGKAGHFLPENRPEVVLEAARAQLAGA